MPLSTLLCACVSACEYVLRVLSCCITTDLMALVMQLVAAEVEGDKQVHAASAVSSCMLLINPSPVSHLLVALRLSFPMYNPLASVKKQNASITGKITSITITAMIGCDCDPGPLRSRGWWRGWAAELTLGGGRGPSAYWLVHFHFPL